MEPPEYPRHMRSGGAADFFAQTANNDIIHTIHYVLPDSCTTGDATTRLTPSVFTARAPGPGTQPGWCEPCTRVNIKSVT